MTTLALGDVTAIGLRKSEVFTTAVEIVLADAQGRQVVFPLRAQDHVAWAKTLVAAFKDVAP